MLARYDHSTARAATRSCVSLQCYLLRCDFFMALLSLLSIFLSFSLEPLYPGLAGFNGLHRATTFRCIQARWIHRISSPGLAAPCPAVFFHPRCPPMVTAARALRAHRFRVNDRNGRIHLRILLTAQSSPSFGRTELIYYIHVPFIT